jgi:hypothetical protein
MSDTISGQTFVLEMHDDYGDSTGEIGKLICRADGLMTLTEAKTDLLPALQAILEAVNAQDEFRIKVPPDPASAPGGVAWDSFYRDDPDLYELLREYMKQKYALYLEPVADDV